MIEELTAALNQVRNNAREEAHRADKTTTRWKGIPATIQGYDADKDVIRFDRGSQPVKEMRTMDLQAMMDLAPGPTDEYHRRLALLFLIDGDSKRADEHIAAASEHPAVEHLKTMLQVSSESSGAEEADPTEEEREAIDQLDDTQKEAIQRMLDVNRSLFEEYAQRLAEMRESEAQALRGRVESKMADVNSEIRSVESDIDYWTRRIRRYYYYSWARERKAELQRELVKLKARKGEVLRQARMGLEAIVKRAANRKESIRTVMLKHKRLILQGRSFTEDEMRVAYEEAMPR